jgi:hypothetical protein
VYAIFALCWSSAVFSLLLKANLFSASQKKVGIVSATLGLVLIGVSAYRMGRAGDAPNPLLGDAIIVATQVNGGKVLRECEPRRFDAQSDARLRSSRPCFLLPRTCSFSRRCTS